MRVIYIEITLANTQLRH